MQVGPEGRGHRFRVSEGQQGARAGQDRLGASRDFYSGDLADAPAKPVTGRVKVLLLMVSWWSFCPIFFPLKIKVLPPGLEPGIAESESAVISSLTTGAKHPKFMPGSQETSPLRIGTPIVEKARPGGKDPIPKSSFPRFHNSPFQHNMDIVEGFRPR